MKIKPILRSALFTLAAVALFTSAVTAQTKPAPKPLKKDTAKKELPAKAAKKEEKKESPVGSRPVMHPKPVKKN